MITARMISGSVYPELIKEVDIELTKVTEDFDCALHTEVFCLATEISTLLFSPSVDS